MNIYVLRHGIAVEPGTPGCPPEPERPLTPKGRRTLCRIAAAMKEMKLSFDAIFSSPYVRARQTAEIVANSLKCRDRLKLVDALEPSSNPHKCVEFLQRLGPSTEDILLVGHEPLLSQLVSLLISGNTSSGIVLKKGALCQLELESPGPRPHARLAWLLTPKQMLRMR